MIIYFIANLTYLLSSMYLHPNFVTLYRFLRNVSKGVDQMFGILLGIVNIAIGLYIYRNPDSDWYRLLTRIPDDVVREDDKILKTQIGGVINIFIGSIIALVGLTTLFEGVDLSMFISSFVLGTAIISLGTYAIKRPESRWFRRNGDDSELSDLGIWFIKFAGKIAIGFGALIILLSAQHLFV